MGATCRRILLKLLIGQKMYLCAYVFIQLLNPCSSTVVAGKLIVSQSGNSSFYETQKIITAFMRASHLSLSCARSIQSTYSSYFFKIHFNIILPSTPGSFKLCLSLRFKLTDVYISAYILYYIILYINFIY